MTDVNIMPGSSIRLDPVDIAGPIQVESNPYGTPVKVELVNPTPVPLMPIYCSGTYCMEVEKGSLVLRNPSTRKIEYGFSKGYLENMLISVASSTITLVNSQTGESHSVTCDVPDTVEEVILAILQGSSFHVPTVMSNGEGKE